MKRPEPAALPCGCERERRVFCAEGLRLWAVVIKEHARSQKTLRYAAYDRADAAYRQHLGIAIQGAPL